MVLRGLKTINNKQELIVLKIDNNLDKQQSDNEQDEQKDGDESVNKLFFLIKVLLIILNLVLLIKYFLQNGLQKLKLLFLLIIISLLLP